MPTDHAFTGQKRDGTGLLYYNARYYDPALGQFVSPDTIIPDSGMAFSYNRHMYTFGNPLKYNDPSGHCPWCIGAVVGAVGGFAGSVVSQVGGQAYDQWQSTGSIDVSELHVDLGKTVQATVAGAVFGGTLGLGSSVAGAVLFQQQQGQRL